MGIRMVSSYANIFMGELEKHLLQSTVNRLCIWWRYIDDMFAVWNNGEEQLQQFLQEINTFHPTIKFTAECSREKVSFLDTTVILDGTILHTDLYTKPTDTHQYLLPSSCHLRYWTSSMPYSQALRLRSICSKKEDFRKRIGELKTYLIARGYREDCVDRQIERAALTPRTNTFTPHTEPRSPIQRVSLVITYYPSLRNTAKIPPNLTYLRKTEGSHPQPTHGSILTT